MRKGWRRIALPASERRRARQAQVEVPAEVLPQGRVLHGRREPSSRARGGKEDVRKREYDAPTLEDKYDKSAMPAVMQVKKFGFAGRTKYTHLNDQDTTAKDNPMNGWMNRKAEGRTSGGGYDRHHGRREEAQARAGSAGALSDKGACCTVARVRL